MSPLGTDFFTNERCRSCGSPDLDVVLDLGDMPLSDGLVPAGFDRAGEPLYPLTLARCPACSLVQILETVEATTLFGEDYPYYSSFSDYLVNHARMNVDAIIARKRLSNDSLVIELASNDGYLLQWFAKAGIDVLGVDPAPGPAKVAIEKGIETIVDFFTVPLARDLVEDGVRADVIIGNNVLAHVPDQNALVEAMEMVLAPNGTIVMEFPYVRDLIEHGEFDTIYHEHGCYFSVTSVRTLFERHGLDLVRVEHHPLHGGSLRVFFERDGAPETSVKAYLESEAAIGMLDASYYRDFADKVNDIRSDLRRLLAELRESGNTVAAYGAAAKGAILINYCDIGPESLDFVVDRNVHKVGMEMPGKAIPIVGVDAIEMRSPDYLVILPWNAKEEIMSQQAAFKAAGGHFVIPLPAPTVL